MKLRRFELSGLADVRSPGEWVAGPERTDELARERRIHVICGSGYRPIGGMGAWTRQALPVSSGR